MRSKKRDREVIRPEPERVQLPCARVSGASRRGCGPQNLPSANGTTHPFQLEPTQTLSSVMAPASPSRRQSPDNPAIISVGGPRPHSELDLVHNLRKAKTMKSPAQTDI